MSNDFYDFESNGCTIQSLIHNINFLGENIIGVEVGISTALNLCMLAQLCKNIKMLYGIDNFKPYTDFKYSKHIGEKEQDNNKIIAFHNIKYSGFKDKIKVIEKDSTIAVNDFEDNSVDFIFLDSYVTEDDCKIDLTNWYEKLKNGGIFAGHDFNINFVKKTVENFYLYYNIKSPLSVFDRVWCFKKENYHG
tara:strand:+ start:52 stop:627 length:576 start_codon:yes stop_codon:yes gene_type:complete